MEILVFGGLIVAALCVFAVFGLALLLVKAVVLLVLLPLRLVVGLVWLPIKLAGGLVGLLLLPVVAVVAVGAAFVSGMMVLTLPLLPLAGLVLLVWLLSRPSKKAAAAWQAALHGRFRLPPLGVALEGIGRLQQRLFLEASSDQLKSDGQPRAREAARHRYRGQAGQRRADREDVGQVHLQRVVEPFAQPERRLPASSAGRRGLRGGRRRRNPAGSACGPAGP